MKLIKNSIQCNYCKDVITSEYRHDFKSCKCGAVSVDGGKDYARRLFKISPNDYTELSEVLELNDSESQVET